MPIKSAWPQLFGSHPAPHEVNKSALRPSVQPYTNLGFAAHRDDHTHAVVLAGSTTDAAQYVPFIGDVYHSTAKKPANSHVTHHIYVTPMNVMSTPDDCAEGIGHKVPHGNTNKLNRCWPKQQHARTTHRTNINGPHRKGPGTGP